MQALEKKPTIRPTAEQLLQHPWLLQHAPKKAMPESMSVKQEPLQLNTSTKVRGARDSHIVRPGDLPAHQLGGPKTVLSP